MPITVEEAEGKLAELVAEGVDDAEIVAEVVEILKRVSASEVERIGMLLLGPLSEVLADAPDKPGKRNVVISTVLSLAASVIATQLHNDGPLLRQAYTRASVELFEEIIFHITSAEIRDVVEKKHGW